jgi:hypothetical protein
VVERLPGGVRGEGLLRMRDAKSIDADDRMTVSSQKEKMDKRFLDDFINSSF